MRIYKENPSLVEGGVDYFLEENVRQFNNIEDCNYLLRRDNKQRGGISIELLQDVIDRERPYTQKLLSIACSVGIIEERIKSVLGITVFSVDAAKHALEKAKERGIITKYANVSKSLPFQDAYFDFVFAGEIIEHILNTRTFLTEMLRVLKPGGYLVLTTPNLARLDDRLKLLFGKTPRQTSPLHPYLYLHIRPFTFDSLKNALESCGFAEIVLRTEALKIEFFDKEVILYSKLFTRLFPTFGATLIVRAKKI